LDRSLTIFGRSGLRSEEGWFGGFPENGRGDLSAGIAIDAGRIDEEIAGNILGDFLCDIRHWITSTTARRIGAVADYIPGCLSEMRTQH